MKRKRKIIEGVIVLLLLGLLGGAIYFSSISYKEDLSYGLKFGKRTLGYVYTISHGKKGLQAFYVYYDENDKECIIDNTSFNESDYDYDIGGEFFVVYYHEDVGSFIFLDSLVTEYVDVRCIDTRPPPLTFSLIVEILLVIIVMIIVIFFYSILVKKLERLIKAVLS